MYTFIVNIKINFIQEHWKLSSSCKLNFHVLVFTVPIQQ
jgi:hypothetical protein